MKLKSIAQQQALRAQAQAAPRATLGPVPGPSVKTQPGQAPSLPPAALASFAAELESLHGLDMEAKLTKRRELVEQYRPQIQAWMQGGGQGEYPPFAWCLQWLFDLGDLEGYFAWLDFALAHGVKPQHSSKHGSFVPCMVYDLLEWAEANNRSERSSAPYLARMIGVAQAHDWAGVGRTRQTQAYYLQFKDLDRAGDACGAIHVGVIGFVLHDASVKTRLLELVDAWANAEWAKDMRAKLAEAKKARAMTPDLQAALTGMLPQST